MRYRRPTIILVVLMCCAACFGQSEFHGLTAGKSTRTDAERVMGKPVKEISPTLIEYRPPPGAETRVSKVYVQYRKASPIVERIEALSAGPIKRSDVLATLHLPQAPTTTHTDVNGRFLEYFGAPFFVVLTYEDADVSKGVSRTARYSRELFESTVETIGRGATTSSLQGIASQTANSPVSIRPPSGSTTVTRNRSSISGRWSGSWTNSKGESGKSNINLSEPGADTIAGDEDGWQIENGRRSGNVLTWEYHNQDHGCSDYTVRWEISADGKTANGIYNVTDRCAKQTYTGKYFNYHH